MSTPRPPFHVLWAASQRIYDPKNPTARVAQLIGGKIASNINAPQNGWTNTCAVRMSYILNSAGVHIPFIKNQTVSGADKRWYFHYVRDVIVFLKQRWGVADLIAPYPPHGGGPLAGKKGVVLFEVSGWNDAVGHASLWNGVACYDHCYFNEPSATYVSTRANFWELA
jgi:hypothetical protein